MAFNLDPAQGEECGRIIQDNLNGKIFEPIQAAYQAMTEAGQNTVTDAILTKFQNVEHLYNESVLPQFQAINKNIGEYTELAYMMHTKNVDETVSAVNVDPVADAGFADAFGI